MQLFSWSAFAHKSYNWQGHFNAKGHIEGCPCAAAALPEQGSCGAGVGAYVPGGPQPGGPAQPPQAPGSVTGGGADPFTGADARPPDQAGRAAAPAHVPAAHYLIFDAVPKQAAIGAKIRALSKGLAAGDGGAPGAAGGVPAAPAALDEAEAAADGPLDGLLARRATEPARTGAKHVCHVVMP